MTRCGSWCSPGGAPTSLGRGLGRVQHRWSARGPGREACIGRTALQAHRLIHLIMEIQLPVVCSVHGWAAGLGCQLALAADFTIAAESARFWEPFTTRGFTPDSAATWLLPRLAGIARAPRNCSCSDGSSPPADAAAWGVIFRAVPDDELESATLALVDELARGERRAIGLTKRCINRSLEAGLHDAMENEALALELSSRTADFKEGLLAFTERRPPDFQGR